MYLRKQPKQLKPANLRKKNSILQSFMTTLYIFEKNILKAKNIC